MTSNFVGYSLYVTLDHNGIDVFIHPLLSSFGFELSRGRLIQNRSLVVPFYSFFNVFKIFLNMLLKVLNKIHFCIIIFIFHTSLFLVLARRTNKTKLYSMWNSIYSIVLKPDITCHYYDSSYYQRLSLQRCFLYPSICFQLLSSTLKRPLEIRFLTLN